MFSFKFEKFSIKNLDFFNFLQIIQLKKWTYFALKDIKSIVTF